MNDCIRPKWHVQGVTALTTTKQTQEVQLPTPPLILNQTHSNTVIDAKDYCEGIEADACHTSEKNTVCVVRTADCIPLLVTHKDGSRIGAIHAGWKGVLNNIAKSALQSFDVENTLIWIGPHICKHCFQVKDDVYNLFVKHRYEAEFTLVADNTWQGDLATIVRQQLIDCGILPHHISSCELCTMENAERFHSFRRDGTKERMLSAIYCTQ